MQNLLYEIGKDRLKTIPHILENRHVFNIKSHIGDNNKICEIIEIVKNVIKTKYNLDLFDYMTEIIERENQIGFYLKWHIDDCAIHKHKTTDGKINNDPINDKFSLYHAKKLPLFTMIIYFSSIHEDFMGGEFEFIDQIINPKKYDVIFFDSREVHRVRRLRSGIRKNVLIKFFVKDK